MLTVSRPPGTGMCAFTLILCAHCCNKCCLDEDYKCSRVAYYLVFRFSSEIRSSSTLESVDRYNLYVFLPTVRKIHLNQPCTCPCCFHYAVSVEESACYMSAPFYILKNIMYETSCQSRFDAQYWMLGAGALGRPRGMEWGGRREEGSGWGTHVYLWRIHFDIWQN